MSPANHTALAMLHRASKTMTNREIARRVGVSPATISLVSRGQYTGDTGGVLDRVAKAFTVAVAYLCPHSQQLVMLQDCIAARESRAPTHNPSRMAAWRTCQLCTEPASYRMD